MLTSLPRWILLTPVVLLAFWLRVHDLAKRPMHADEANQAVKLGELLENGHYAFDPRDHHGPTLYYAAVPIAWARGQHSLAALDETTLRLVPAIFGTAAVLLVGLLAAPLGLWPALVAALLVAICPPAVYYSRYFVQETLLLTFTLGAFACAQRAGRTGNLRWALATGACIGLMQATKATARLFLTAAALAAFVAQKLTATERPTAPSPRRSTAVLFAAGLGSALVAAALLYSSFFTHLGGLHDALGAYAYALKRFGYDAPLTGHEKPWWYYLHLYGWFRQGGLLWQQLVFSILAACGCGVALFRREPLVRTAAIYTLIIGAAFSIFAYKTPWQAIHFVPGMAILAAAALAGLAHLPTGKFIAVPLALLVGASQLQQVRFSSYLRPADQRNPFAYVHSSPDVLKYRALAEAALARTPGQPVRVISEEYWPLPWYLRGVQNVGYWSTPPAECDGALVVASMTQADEVRARLHGNYRESFLGLRPGFVCILFTPES